MAKTFVTLKDKKQYTITDWTGGLNENARVYAVAPNELRACSNMEIRKKGALVVRSGHEKYEATADINLPAKDQFYYVHRDGTRKMVMYSGDSDAAGDEKKQVLVDNDAGVYTSIATQGTIDGHCRFTQYRDTLFFGAEDRIIDTVPTSQLGLHSYNSDGGNVQNPGEDIRGEATTTTFAGFITNTKLTTGGVLEPRNYAYRICWEISHDTDFMGESYPVWDNVATLAGVPGDFGPRWSKEQRNILQENVNHTGGGTETNKVQFKKPASTPSDFPDTATTVNIYRSGPDIQVDTFFPKPQQEDDRFFLIGSFDAATYRAASVGTVLFEDLGEIPIGVQIRHFPKRVPPRSRFSTVHKDRLWLAYVVEVEPAGGVEKIRVHRVYASEFREPYVFPDGSWVDVQPNEGEGITGIISWRNKIMLVFKNNSTYAVIGGDDVDFAGNPDISVEIISEDIGCIAPSSIVVAEGRVMWLSHRGVYYFDGTIPQPLKNVNIEDTLRAIDGTLDYDSAMGYYSLERELWVGHDVSTDDAVISKFNFVTGAWSNHEAPAGTSSVASFVEKHAKNQRPEFYIGLNASGTKLEDEAIVFKADTTRWFDEWTGVTDLSWSFKTKQFDFGTPWAQKTINAIGIDCNVPDTTGITIRITCDDRLDTNTDPAGDITISEAIVGHKLIMLDTRIRGKKIGFEISGTQTTGPTEVYGLSVYYTIDEAVKDE